MYKEKKDPTENKKQSEESVWMSQSKVSQVAHMVLGVLPPGVQGAINHSHRKGLGRLLKLLN